MTLEFFESVFGVEDGDEKFRQMDTDRNGFVTQSEWLDHFGKASYTDMHYRDEARPFEELSDSSRRILYNLLGFLRCKNAVEKTALAVLPKDYMRQRSSFSVDKKLLRQTRGDGSSIDSYDAVIAHCLPTYRPFVTLMTHIVEAAGLRPDAVPIHRGKPVVEGFTSLTIAPLKGRERCDEKAANEYDGEYSMLIDCIRCSIIVDTEAQLLSVADALGGAGVSVEEMVGGARGSTSDEVPRFALLRLKNRYAEPLFNGYRDALYSIALDSPGGGWVVCEVQLHLGAILAHKKKSHAVRAVALLPQSHHAVALPPQSHLAVQSASAEPHL